ncbi:hypothetical protein B296_00039019 [Ensete ventricosum]|uniref:Uncharacterized protein n=1 Tax=Ensete ventricosum TaxID=4639 RepID=A0A426XZR1_ENSVE|nr:hypothetical protein B296_00039019 [Ensete ventricosum]
MSYKHDFVKKYDGHKRCAKSRVKLSFNRFFMQHLVFHGKSYEHGFMQKHDDNSFYVKSSFDQFFAHHLKNSKYWPFPTY